MIVQIEGIRQSDGKRVRFKADFDSIDAAVDKARELGIDVSSLSTWDDLGASFGETDAHVSGESHGAPPHGRAWTSGRISIGLACAGAIVVTAVVAWNGRRGAIYDDEVVAWSISDAQPVVGFDGEGDGIAHLPASRWKPGERHPTVANVRAGQAPGKWEAEPGYVLAGSTILSAEWRAGLNHPEHANIRSASVEQQWAADPGYQFPRKGDLAVEWSPGRLHPDHAKISASTTEGRWRSDPGYVFVDPKASFEVKWKQGLSHLSFPNILSADREGYWTPEAGYEFISSESLGVRWKPGMPHRTAPHVVASEAEGKWSAAPGYRFANSVAGDLAVVAKSSPKMEEAIQNGIAAALLNAAKQGFEGSDSLLGDIFGEVARQGRQTALKDAARSAFPGADYKSVGAAVDLIGQSLDGQLTADNWLSPYTRDEVVRRLKVASPNDPYVYDLADFVCGVCSGAR